MTDPSPQIDSAGHHHRFVVLDAWRGIAALLVAQLHFELLLAPQSHLHFIPLIQNSALMVDFFFVLSGFVISHVGLGKLNDGGAAAAFMIRRFGRLWPLQFATLAVMLAISCAMAVAFGSPVFSENRSAASLFYNLFLVQALHTQPRDMWNGPAWSISAEFYTYFVFAGVCLLAARRQIPTVLPAVVLILLSVAILIGWGGMDATYDFGFFRCLYGFFLGHLTYLFWRRRKNRSSKLEWPAAGLALAAVWFGDSPIVQFLAPLAFALLVWVFAAEKGLLSRIGQGRFLQYMGQLSYSIYMLHYLWVYYLAMGFNLLDVKMGFHILTLVSMAVGDTVVTMPAIVTPNLWVGDLEALLYALAVILSAAISFRFLEQPARLYFNNLSKRLVKRRGTKAA